MSTDPTTPTVSPKTKWVKSIDDVLLNIKMKRLMAYEMKRLKEVKDEREYWQRWRRADRLKKEQYIEEKKCHRREESDQRIKKEEELDARQRQRKEKEKAVTTSSNRFRSGKSCSSADDLKVPTRAAPLPPSSTAPSWSSSIFGLKDSKHNIQKGSLVKKKPPPRPPPPKFSPSRDVHENLQKTQPRAISDASGFLIDWSSPPSSPTSTTRSSSDAISVNSFGSDSVNASSGNTSNVESGFEDDFDLFGAASSAAPKPVDPWSPAPVAAKPETKSWVSFSPNASKKLVIPTIIRVKPERPRVPKVLEKKYEMDALADVFLKSRLQAQSVEEEDDGWRSESPPMPSGPPPAPPQHLMNLTNKSYEMATAIFDYQGQPGDLSFRQGDRITIIRHIDNNWVEASLNGRSGTAPSNHLQIEGKDTNIASAMHQFVAETWEDLTLQPGDKVVLLGRINSDWLYGEVANRRGQFPANFVDHVPAYLPPWTTS